MKEGSFPNKLNQLLHQKAGEIGGHVTHGGLRVGPSGRIGSGSTDCSGVSPDEAAPQFKQLLQLFCHIGDSEHSFAVTRVLSWA